MADDVGVLYVLLVTKRIPGGGILHVFDLVGLPSDEMVLVQCHILARVAEYSYSRNQFCNDAAHWVVGPPQ